MNLKTLDMIVDVLSKEMKKVYDLRQEAQSTVDKDRYTSDFIKLTDHYIEAMRLQKESGAV